MKRKEKKSEKEKKNENERKSERESENEIEIEEKEKTGLEEINLLLTQEFSRSSILCHQKIIILPGRNLQGKSQRIIILTLNSLTRLPIITNHCS